MLFQLDPMPELRAFPGAADRPLPERNGPAREARRLLDAYG